MLALYYCFSCGGGIKLKIYASGRFPEWNARVHSFPAAVAAAARFVRRSGLPCKLGEHIFNAGWRAS